MLEDSPIMIEIREAIDFVGGTIIEINRGLVVWRDAEGRYHGLRVTGTRYDPKTQQLTDWQFDYGEAPCVTLPEIFPQYLTEITQVVVAQTQPHISLHPTRTK